MGGGLGLATLTWVGHVDCVAVLDTSQAIVLLCTMLLSITCFGPEFLKLRGGTYRVLYLYS